jgi:hypothetical protein
MTANKGIPGVAGFHTELETRAKSQVALTVPNCSGTAPLAIL